MDVNTYPCPKIGQVFGQYLLSILHFVIANADNAWQPIVFPYCGDVWLLC